MFRNRSSSSTWLIGIGAVAAILIVVSVIINVALDSSGDDLRPADTPEGTVQRYLIALTEDRPEEAFSYVSQTQQTCTLAHFIDSTSYHRGENFSASLDRVSHDDDSTVVTVRITESFGSSIFDQGRRDFHQLFTLADEDGEWRFMDPPWPMSWCPPDPEGEIDLSPSDVPKPATRSRIASGIGS